MLVFQPRLSVVALLKTLIKRFFEYRTTLLPLKILFRLVASYFYTLTHCNRNSEGRPKLHTERNMVLEISQHQERHCTSWYNSSKYQVGKGERLIVLDAITEVGPLRCNGAETTASVNSDTIAVVVAMTKVETKILCLRYEHGCTRERGTIKMPWITKSFEIGSIIALYQLGKSDTQNFLAVLS